MEEGKRKKKEKKKKRKSAKEINGTQADLEFSGYFYKSKTSPSLGVIVGSQS